MEKIITHQPLIYAGTTGMGKDYCYAEFVKNLNSGDPYFAKLACHYFSRAKRAHETEGVSGFFSADKDIDKLEDDEAFAFLYEEYKNRYGMLKVDIKKDLAQNHLAIMVGEPKTNDYVYSQLLTNGYQAKILLVIRELTGVIEGIKKRPASNPNEKEERIEIAKNNFEDYMNYVEKKAPYKFILDNRRGACDIFGQTKKIIDTVIPA